MWFVGPKASMKSLVKSRSWSRSGKPGEVSKAMVSRDRLTGLIQNFFLFYACLDENVGNWRELDFCALACIGRPARVPLSDVMFRKSTFPGPAGWQKREEAHVTIL